MENSFVPGGDAELALPYTEKDIKRTLIYKKTRDSDIRLLELEDGRYIYVSEVGLSRSTYVSKDLLKLAESFLNELDKKELGL